jgi:hypothetical protein
MTVRKEVKDAAGHIASAKDKLATYQANHPSGHPRVEPEISQAQLEMLEIIAEALIAGAEKARP